MGAARFGLVAGVLTLGGCCLQVVSGTGLQFGVSGTSIGGGTSSRGTSAGQTTLGGGSTSGGGAAANSTSGGSTTGGGSGSTTSGGATTSGGLCATTAATNLHSTARYAKSLTAVASASGDLDGDGLLDLVAAQAAEFDGGFITEYSLFLGQSDGGMSGPWLSDGDGGLNAPAVSYVSADTAIALGDVDDNGWLDVVVGSNVNVFVTLNQGGGLLGNTALYQATQSVYGIGIGDLNGDGFPDLVLAETGNLGGNGAVEVMFGVGQGKFANPVPLPGIGATRFGSLVVADLNQDGLPDIAANTSDASHLAILLNRGGDAGFTTTLYPTPVNAQMVILPRAGGAPDLILGDATVALGSPFDPSGTIQILTNAGDGTFSIGPTYTAPGALFLTVGDFNGDCIPDIATSIFLECELTGSGISVLYGDAAGGFRPPVSLKTYGTAPSSLAALGPVGSPRALSIVDDCGAGFTVYGNASE